MARISWGNEEHRPVGRCRSFLARGLLRPLYLPFFCRQLFLQNGLRAVRKPFCIVASGVPERPEGPGRQRDTALLTMLATARAASSSTSTYFSPSR